MSKEYKLAWWGIICIILAIIPFLVPPWSSLFNFSPTGVMQIDNVFKAFYPGQFVTTSMFFILAIKFIYNSISIFRVKRQIQRLKNMDDKNNYR